MSARTASFVSKRAQRFVPIAVSLKEVGQVPGARERGPFLVVAETTCHDDVVEAVVSAVAPWDEVIDLASSPDRPSTVEASPGLELKQSSGDTGKESTLAVLGRPTCCRVWHATARYTAERTSGWRNSSRSARTRTRSAASAATRPRWSMSSSAAARAIVPRPPVPSAAESRASHAPAAAAARLARGTPVPAMLAWAARPRAAPAR